ncbi:MAG: TIGR00266 family protein [Candidatus Dormibacteraeota bacterium]|nr:TIGR00266 family protein [Candidatus Dormibacteraeota bacterium]
MQDKIIGTTMPVLELTLEPGEAIFAESGELSWMTSSIVMRTSTQFGGGGGIGGVFKRAVGGSSIFMTEYSAQGAPGMVAFASKLPGQIFPIDVTPQPGYGYLAHRHAFVCANHGVELSIAFQQRLGAGFFGGDGFRLQKISGQGRAWCELSGEIVTYDLQPGEMLRVHPGHVGLFQDTVQFQITTVKGIKNKIFGGDGIFLAQMVGPGRVWLQSLPLQKLAQALGEFFPQEAAEAGAAGAVGGAIARGIFGGR